MSPRLYLVYGLDISLDTFNLFKPTGYVMHQQVYPFGTGVLHLIQINHQPDATIFQFIILMFVYS